MCFGIDMLDIQKKQVGVFHECVKLLEKRFISGKRIAGSIDHSMDAFLFCFLEKLNQKIHLKERFSSADGNSAFAAPVGAVAESLFQKFVGRHQVGVIGTPGVRIVTKLTAHLTALYKNHKADAWTIYGPKAFDRVNGTFAMTKFVHARNER